ncbi:phosphotransferase enzyme family protein [Saccharopolyspora phatthalungensis]|uniref:Ser/Thr protein kinase RdoA (MazF antagonist) n=1 Tax=Saccharopolyspora phatthalungensis TaxID=664693 RepID=A0A840Q0L4_9PSEU|nr:aminoglycoside phosphotransferase family protein [Saccharopolyspora phatthalungensis]MBB5156072.1 Ser/Thr protein kinase RdoA (MazF antagonist) [Saccharopolyspora phatthalungensis]
MTATRFTRDSARRIARLACEEAALRVADSDLALIRLGENALFSVASEGVVVRVGRTLDYWPEVAREVAVARWLRAEGLPAAEIVEEIDQPLAVDGHPVTIWRYIAGEPAPYERIGDLGVLLRRLHLLTPPAELMAHDEDVLGRVQRRVESSPIAEPDRNFLLRRLVELREEVADLDYTLPPALIHGDAHIKNVMVSDGRSILIDFEGVAYGQPEWDVGMTATEYSTAGWWRPDQYEAFVEGYGFDVMRWPGFPTVRSVHELKMTTWIMQRVRDNSDIAEEFASRMRTIRDRVPSAWSPW